MDDVCNIVSFVHCNVEKYARIIHGAQQFLSQTLLSYSREKRKPHLTGGLYHSSRSTVQFYNDSLLDSNASTFFSNNPNWPFE